MNTRDVDWSKTQRLSVAKLVAIHDPLTTWGVEVTVEDIERAFYEGRRQKWAKDWALVKTFDHAARVATLMREGWTDTIYVHRSMDDGPRTNPVVDGNHRLAAAFVLKNEFILADCNGPPELLLPLLYDR